MPALNVINGTVINGVSQFDVPPDINIVQNRMPIGGSALLPVNPLTNIGVTFTVIADGEVVYQSSVASEAVHRLPTGFKASMWQFQIVSNTRIYSVELSETAKGLTGV